MEALILLWLVIFLFFAGVIGWNLYMMTCHPDTYLRLKEHDREAKKQFVETVTKAAGPALLKTAIKFLKK